MDTVKLKGKNETLFSKTAFRSLMEPLLVVFNKAVSDIFENREYYIAYSIPGGVYGYFKDHDLSDEEVSDIKNRIRKLISANLDFQQEILPKEKVLRYFDENRRTDILELLQSKPNDLMDSMHLAHLNGNGELFFNHVNEHYERLDKFRFFRFKKGFFLIADPGFFERVLPQRLEISKYLKRFDESEEAMKQLGIESIAQLNEVIENGELPEFIKIS